MSNEKGGVLPRGPRAVQTNQSISNDEKQQQQEKLVQGAPLSTAQTTQTNPIEEKQQEESKYPWRNNTTMSEDELMYMKQKKSYDVVLELMLRMDFIKKQKKPKVFGQKITETSMLHEALDDWTKKELKALGYSIK